GHPVDRTPFAGDGAWIDYGNVRTLSFVDVLRGRSDVRGKVVVVGDVDPILLDVHPTPIGPATPGPEINANAIATILDDFPLRERRRLRTAFARFVPPEIVDDVVGQADGARLGGTELQATVLFSDLRGFTTVAEHLPAPRVIELLNRYLTEMSDAILDHGGTV